MTSLSTQIVIDDDLMEYELNPKMLASLEPRAHQAKRPHFMIHDSSRPAPSTLVIGSFRSAAQPVTEEDSLRAPES